MQHEVMRKRPAEIVRPPAATLVDIPRPIGEFVVRRKTEAAVLREVGRLQRKGYVAGASAMARYHARAGGGFGVKVSLLRPLPAPMPGWAKGCALVGTVLVACSVVGIIALRAFADLVGAAAGLPWSVIVGGAVVVIVALAIVKRVVFGGGSITVTQKVTIRR